MQNDTRERLLDAAAQVIRRDGLARATTRLIAREAGCSEALLYKYFPDKQEMFLRVLTERAPRISDPAELLGQGTVAENLELLVAQLIAFYRESFPMAASIFGDAALLSAHRAGMDAQGAGPHGPQARVAAYLAAEQDAGRLGPDLDADAAARLLVGAALHEAFLLAYSGEDREVEPALAGRLVDAVAGIRA